MGDIRTRSQRIDFLGFLRSQLSGLQGIPTLCYELIQNADDVKDEHGNPGALRITFDVCDDALWVENDGVFREIDFDRMERLSWGNKRDEENTTGAFGIGFISVYQVTDMPEIFSSGRHWKFKPSATEDKRIQEEFIETQHTRFRLPWAFEVSRTRQELGIPAIDKTQLDIITAQIGAAIEEAALFLKQITTLEVKRSGQPVHCIKTIIDNDILLINKDGHDIIWRIFEGNFDFRAQNMRRRYGALIEEKRKPVITLAIPETPHDNGLLYAFLPSETKTSLPFHINADFYPSSDRKRILLENDYKSDWNRLALECAAETLAWHLDQVLEIFAPEAFWKFADFVYQASESKTLSPVFTHFWEGLKTPIREKPTVLTHSGKKLPPPQSVFLDASELVQSAAILEELGIHTTHPDLRNYRNLLLDTGTRLLKVTDLIEALQSTGLNRRTELVDMPTLLRSESGLRIFWSALNHLWGRASYLEKQTAAASLENCAIAYGSDGAFWPSVQIYQADSHTQTLFSKFSPIIWLVQNENATPLPSNLVPQFKLCEGLVTLKEIQEELPSAWASGIFSPQEIYDWMENNRSEIANNPEIQQVIRSLAIWPTAKGTLQPLDTLFLAGDFDDPLHLAQLVNIEALGGRRELLERELGVNKLDFVTYVRDWIPIALNSSQMDRANQFRLIEVLARKLGNLQGQADIQNTLAGLPLVWCGDELFISALNVYFNTKEVRNVLGKETSIAQLPIEQPEAIYALYEWLGVAESPRPEDIITRVRDIALAPPESTSLRIIENIFDYLASNWHLWSSNTQYEFSPLKREKWLPGSQKTDEWYEPAHVYAIYQKYLFESQGNFLNLDRLLQQKGSDLIKFLGIKTEPSTQQVVLHLLYCSYREIAVTQEIYVYLTRYANEPAIRQLLGKSCLYLETPTGINKYYRPDQVFWEQHPFGQYRIRLGADFGRYKALLEQLNVKEIPDARDAIAVLMEIAEEFGKSNILVEEGTDIEKIVIMCWKLLNIALENGTIIATDIKKAIGDKKTIPDSRHILEPPIHLFFDDRPGWGQKFELIKHSLVRAVEGAWLAMEAAGVQRLSNAVTVDLHRCDNPHEDSKMAERLSERIPLIRRVIEAHRSKGTTGFELEKLEAITFSEAEHIEIVRVFDGFGRQEFSQLESVDAIQLDGELYFCSEKGSSPWKSIARELSFVLYPSGELNSLGMELKEVLSQSVPDANATLDEYGYPRVEQAQEPMPGPIAKPGTVGAGREPITGGEDKKYPPILGVPDSKEPKKAKTEKTKNNWLASYVCPPDEGGNEEESKPTDSDWASRRNEIAEMGVAYVMEYELEHKRAPTDMETIQVHHPGYDIKSVDEKGQTRYIEVKSLTGIWNRPNPAKMTTKEFEDARELGESYWLYVVEKVETDDRRLYTIRNPANRANYYLFDHGWKPLSE